MAVNVGVRDGQVRTVLGVLAMFGTALLVAETEGALWAVGTLLGAIVLLASGTLRVCPLYSLFGISTCR